MTSSTTIIDLELIVLGLAILLFAFRGGVCACLASAFGLVVFFGLGLLMSGVYKINFTHSAPYGLYRLIPAHPPAAIHGRFVTIDPAAIPSSKTYNPLQAPMMKRVIGTAGDVISLDGSYLAISGRSLGLQSIVHTRDNSGKALSHPNYPVTVPIGSIWVMSDNSFGWDSRYFGPVALKDVMAFAEPIFTW